MAPVVNPLEFFLILIKLLKSVEFNPVEFNSVRFDSVDFNSSGVSESTLMEQANLLSL